MIENEDDEDVLEKGITFKSVVKNLAIILLIMLGVLLIYFGNSENQTTNWLIGFMLICGGSALMQFQKQLADPLRQTLTILICNLCGGTKVRNFEKGDFVFQKRDKCAKCNDLMEIKQIYSVKLKKPTEVTTPKTPISKSKNEEKKI